MDQFKKYLIAVDKNMNIKSTESAFLEYIGRDRLRNLDEVIPPQDLMQLRNAVFAIDPGALCLSCFRIRTASGRLNWIAANVEKEDDNDDLIHMELSDIQTLKSEGVLAHYDEMTGLLNKQGIRDLAEKLTDQYPRKKFYFCLMDIDHFKNVNDTFGHMVGDEVITDVAHIVRDCVGNYGSVGRIGGDEFMLVLDKVDNKPKAREILANIRETVEEKYTQFKGSLDITVSIGAGLYPDYACTYEELFQLADKMLYRAKMKGRNRYIIYTPEVHGDVLSKDPEQKTDTVIFHSASAGDKLKLMMKFLTGFLHQTDIPIQTAIEHILSAYELDEVYVFQESLEKSQFGIKRVNVEKGDYRIESRFASMPILADPQFQELINENGYAVANIFDLHKDKQSEVIKFMEENEQRFMLVYHMKEGRKGGYIVYANHRDSACRLSDADTLDLLYFGKMLEITSMER